ncbi:MAG: hypothetical protein KatS3mg126_2083 [Lysobacteraceae bacterium]|nr:MAG: hypothetical protein KatS3mg126_2083 [Xanthomonadaceae bacterium]
MRWLVRRVHRKAKGQISYEDDIHFGDVLTVGRGADQALFLPDMRVALEHARITSPARGRYRVESRIEAGLRIDGAIVHQATCGPGTLIELGGFRIELREPDADFDAAVEISLAERSEAASTSGQRLPMSLAETRLSRRLPSWILFVGILLLFLLLPAASHFAPGLSAFLEAAPLPSRKAWQAGELASAHHFFGSECKACHSQPFAWVKDQDCLACHAGTHGHADPARFDLPELGKARCAHCHRDHNGPDGLVRTDASLCSDCHRDLAGRTGGASRLESASDFGLDHPPFRVTLPRWDEDGRYRPQRTALVAGLKEGSGLKFPHDVHLDPAGVNGPDGRRVLACADCHVPEPGGAGMQPIDFETMCQGCHALSFDITAPDREVPHARIAEIFYMLDEFYARRALEGEVRDPSAPASLRVRRRPGQAVQPEQRQLALTWARDKARQVGESLFTGKACTVCHQVFPTRSTEEPWKVAPVRLNGKWFAKARFDHGSHRTMACTDCHAAPASHSSDDLLLPDMANCRQCHAGEHGAKDRIATPCLACHGYHLPDQPPLGARP